ncbi:MAG: hypothetical protein WBO10_00500 [Pyrinomonadaceae bacterium]
MVTEAIRRVQVGTDKTAAELALKRLGNELGQVEEEYYSVVAEKTKQKESNTKVFGLIWLVGVVFCVAFLMQGGLGIVLAVIGFIGGTFGVFYYGSQQESSITSKFADAEKDLLSKRNRIRTRIEENRRLVDS